MVTMGPQLLDRGTARSGGSGYQLTAANLKAYGTNPITDRRSILDQHARKRSAHLRRTHEPARIVSLECAGFEREERHALRCSFTLPSAPDRFENHDAAVHETSASVRGCYHKVVATDSSNKSPDPIEAAELLDGVNVEDKQTVVRKTPVRGTRSPCGDSPSEVRHHQHRWPQARLPSVVDTGIRQHAARRWVVILRISDGVHHQTYAACKGAMWKWLVRYDPAIVSGSSN